MADTTTNASTDARTAQAYSAQAYTAGGAQRDAVALPTELFDGTVNVPAMHQVVKAYLANQRQGTASTKNRRYVTGGNQKPWKQKGTGRARQGSTRAPHWVGGGTVFGPTPRDYTQRINKKVKVLARRSALNARASENALFVIDRFSYDAPKTAQLVGLLESMNVLDKKVLVLTDGVNHNVYMSGRNLPRAHVMPFADASTYHILWSDVVLVESGAIGESLAPVPESEREQNAASAPARKTVTKTSGRKSAAKSATKTAKQSSAKKSAARKSGAKKSATKSAKKSATKTTAKKATAKKTAAKKSASKKKGS